MKPAATPARVPAWRPRLVQVLLMACFASLFVRALYLQGFHRKFLLEQGQQRITRVIQLTATRGRILDRNGSPLAVSTPMATIAASPADVHFSGNQLAALARLLDMSPQEIEQKVADPHRDFVYLKRQIPPDVGGEVKALDIPGIFLQKEYKRYYPAGDMLAQEIGFTNVNDQGQEGVELAWQNWLAGRPGSERVVKDNKGHIIENGQDIRVPVEGKDLTLSIDRRIQYLAWRDLVNAIQANKAKAGAIVVLDAHTGEVLAMANWPSFNPNNRTHLTPGSTRNRAITDMYEPGSIMKPFSLSAVLESGHFNTNSVIDTSPGYWKVGDRVIHDAEKMGLLTFSQVLQKSSNIGTAKMALTLSPQYMWSLYHRVGFDQPPHTGFPGEARGLLRPWKTWRPIGQATMSFGQGISVSLMQLAKAYTVFANDGEMLPVSMLKLSAPPAGTPVISAKTANEIRTMMELVTQPGGTAPQAAIRGYYVAGKTGTAQVEENGHYASGKYIASFVGMAPGTNPRLICAVTIDEPSNGKHFGGEVAAPVFADVMSNSLRLLDIPPDWPQQFAEPVDPKAEAAAEKPIDD